MSHATWLSEMSSGVPAMDKLHFEILAALDKLSSVADSDFCGNFNSFVSQVEGAFRLEEQWMEDIQFPALRTHLEQHSRILGGLHNVHARVMDGDIGLGREVVGTLLPQWFAFHASTMDAVLALAMQMAHFETAQPVTPKNRFMTPFATSS
jgi:hemerythrin